MTLKIQCWSCEKEWEENSQPITCTHCNKVQKVAPAISPFTVLGFEKPHFDLDEEDLESRWIRRSRKCHPDRYAIRDATERRYAVEQMAATNEAYKLLENVISRGLYLAQEAGLPTETFPPETFLMEMMEAQEIASEGGSDSSALKADMESRFKADCTKLAQVLDQGTGSVEEVPGALTRLRYYRRVLDAIAGARTEF